MKPSLQLNLTQQLTMTPQLQQAIRLLQLSTLDLQQEIQQQLESNPMLELESSPAEEFETRVDIAVDNEDEFQWSTLYSGTQKDKLYNENAYIFENLHKTTTTLKDHLHWQLGLTPMSEIDQVIATAVIDALNSEGFLTVSIKDLHACLNSKDFPLTHDEIAVVVHRIQRFDPVGCAAANLQESLLIQLEQITLPKKQKDIAQNIIRDDLSLLAGRDNKELIRKYNLTSLELEKILGVVQSLHPHPGSIISAEQPEYVIPDLTVKKIDNQWTVRLNQELLPKLHINTYYASLIKRANDSKENQYLKSSLNDARFFLNSIQSRQETLLKVAQFIMNYQKEFLEKGEEAIKPLILNQVATELNLHESTVSRVTTQKFILTPHGLFELKFFFSSLISSTKGDDYSSTAIRAMIKKLIKSEHPEKPLSDASIKRWLSKSGIDIARRTIAKYREEMGIGSSMARKLSR